MEDFLRQNAPWLLLGHQKPDGDSVGSVLAMLRLLDLLEIPAEAHLPANIPKGSQSLWHELKHEDGIETQNIMALDTAWPEHLDGPTILPIKLQFDHHATNPAYAEENIIDADAPATCALVFELAKEIYPQALKDTLFQRAIWLGLVSDTGYFQNRNANTRAFAIAAELLKFGFQPNKYQAEVKPGIPWHVRQRVANTMTRTHLVMEGKVIHAHLRTRDLRPSEEDMAKNMLLREMGEIEGVEVVLLTRTTREGRFSGSLRCNTGSDWNMNIMAQKLFRGGGHPGAAGFVVRRRGKTQDQARRIRRQIVQYLREEYQA